jgi:hypothetical protein
MRFVKWSGSSNNVGRKAKRNTTNREEVRTVLIAKKNEEQFVCK